MDCGSQRELARQGAEGLSTNGTEGPNGPLTVQSHNQGDCVKGKRRSVVMEEGRRPSWAFIPKGKRSPERV